MPVRSVHLTNRSLLSCSIVPSSSGVGQIVHLRTNKAALLDLTTFCSFSPFFCAPQFTSLISEAGLHLIFFLGAASLFSLGAGTIKCALFFTSPFTPSLLPAVRFSCDVFAFQKTARLCLSDLSIISLFLAQRPTTSLLFGDQLLHHGSALVVPVMQNLATSSSLP
jgi:hypothetical protein